MAQPLVGIIMGSRSDWETMRHAAEMLESLGVPYERVLYDPAVVAITNPIAASGPLSIQRAA